MSKNKNQIFFIIILLIIKTNQFKNLKGPLLSCPSQNFFNLNFKTLSLLSQKNTNQNFPEVLSDKELEKYKANLSLRKEFLTSLSFLPQSFAPQDKNYILSLNKMVNIFSVVSIMPIFFILFYLFMRFYFKKCKGPQKTEQVSHLFRNFTWIIFFFASITSFLLIFIILIYSIKIRYNLGNSFENSTKKMTNLIQNSTDLEKIITNLRNNHNDTVKEILPKSDLVKKFVNGVNDSLSLSTNNINDLLKLDTSRNNYNIILFFSYIIIIGITFFCFLQKQLLILTILAILTYFFIPIILLNEGVTTKYFFLYGDLCQSIYNAIRENEFPVPEKGLGYYINCLNKTVKSELYSINYQLNKASKYDSSIINYINLNVKPLLNCEVVYESIPILEKDFCVNTLDWFQIIIQLSLWLILSTFILANGIGRIEVLVWKKKKEIDSMIENEESIL